MGIRINTNNNGSGSGGDLGKVILKIDNLAVNKRANNDFNIIEIGDEIRGELPFNSGRHIVAEVTALPYTDDNNLNIFSINQQ